MASQRKATRGGNARKIGRDKVKCASYRARHIREKNKARKIKRHLKRHPNDKKAWSALEKIKSFI